MKRNMCNIIFLVTLVFCVLYPVKNLLGEGGFLYWSVRGNYKIWLELAVWFGLAIFGLKKRKGYWILGLLITFSYLHEMILPMLGAFLYLILSTLVGKLLTRFLFRGEAEFIVSYFLGMVTLTIIYALLSLLHLGSILNIKILDAILIVGLGLWYWKRIYTDWIKRVSIIIRKERTVVEYIQYVIIMLFLMISVGRANLSLDYDSVWYGLRSAFALCNRTGIYDKLNLIGCVYTYPKGYEVYSLPLADWPSYGFVYAGNIIFLFLIMYLVYRICRIFSTHIQAMWGVTVLVMIPGILNMAITAKPDICTLFVQILMIYFSIKFLRENNAFDFGMILSTYIYSLTLKPTAVLFSTSILLAILFIMMLYRRKPKYEKNSLMILILAFFDLVLIWLRTYWFTGIPATSVAGKFFQILGMTDKYPYASGQFSQFRTGDLFGKEGFVEMAVRIKEFFLAPASQEMDHVIIAWGTTLCTFLCFVVFLGGIVEGRRLLRMVRQRSEITFLGVLFLGELFAAILSLVLLKKPDGNYFMLFYVVTTAAGVLCAQHLLLHGEVISRGIMYAAIPLFALLNVILSGSVNWAWVNEFSEIKWINCGFYNHVEEYRRQMYESGAVRIYDTLAENPSNQVLAYGIHPNVERIPCVIESTLDVDYWGNEKLMYTPDDFLEFVDFVDYDYIYIQKEYDQLSEKDYVNLKALISSGKVSSIVEENEHLLFILGISDDEKTIDRLKKEFERFYLEKKGNVSE
ncbi:MAG: hypothetical protein HFI93_06310 [Lachnospiraceae bacterium]|nr:hypothetical protein [Lachnospiraceae bacterium]